MFWPAIVMGMWLGSALSGRKVQTNLEKAIYFLRSRGMFSYRMKWKVFVPSTRCLEGSDGLVPMPWNSLLNSDQFLYWEIIYLTL